MYAYSWCHSLIKIFVYELHQTPISDYKICKSIKVLRIPFVSFTRTLLISSHEDHISKTLTVIYKEHISDDVVNCYTQNVLFFFSLFSPTLCSFGNGIPFLFIQNHSVLTAAIHSNFIRMCAN